MLGEVSSRVTPSAWRHLSAMLLFAIFTVVVFFGYGTGAFLVGTDAMGLPSELSITAGEGSFFSAWRAFTSLGHPEMPSPVTASFYWLAVGQLGLDPLVLAKAIVVLSFFLASALMYLCAFSLTRTHMGSLVAGFVYGYNQMFLAQVTEVHYYFLIGYAAFPLLFLLVYRSVIGRSRWGLALLPVGCVLFGSVAAPNLVEIAAAFLLLFGALYIALSRERHWKAVLSRSVILLVAVGMVVMPLALLTLSGGSATLDAHYPIEQTQPYSSRDLYHAFVLSSTENTFIWESPVKQWVCSLMPLEVGLAIAVAIPLAALSSLAFRRTEPLVLPLLLPALLFVFVSKGPNPPAGEVFEWAFRSVPFVDSIRVYGRLLLLVGFCYALLICIVVRQLQNGPPPRDLRRTYAPVARAKRRFWPYRGRALALVVVACVLLPSVAVFSGEVRGFDLPAPYAKPYEWVSEQPGDYRILTLPLNKLYYTNPQVHLGGYPTTNTLDPGVYSTLITGKPFAYGLETSYFWGFVDEAQTERSIGYLNLTELLGGAASVKYVVCQVYANGTQISEFASMNGATTEANFTGGASVLGNSYWAPRVHLTSSTYLYTGAPNDMLMAIGLGAVPDGLAGFIQSSQLDRERLQELLPLVDGIILADGDITELVASTTAWSEGEDVALTDFADSGSIATDQRWSVVLDKYAYGYTNGPTADTGARASLTVPMPPSDGRDRDLLLKMVSGPTAGQLMITLGGAQVAQVRPYSLQEHEAWVRVRGIPAELSGDLVLTNDGPGGSSVERAILAPHDEMDAAFNDTLALLEPYKDKVVMTIGGTSSGLWAGGGAAEIGPLGLGRSSPAQENRSSSLNLTVPWSGSYSIIAMQENGTRANLTFDDTVLAPSSSSGRAWAYASNVTSGEPHTLGVNSSLLYGLVVRSGMSQGVAEGGSVEYDHLSNTEYKVQVSTPRPSWLLLSESYSPLWKAYIGGEELEHVKMDGVVNGYLVPAGENQTITIRYAGQEAYWDTVILMAALTLSVTALMAAWALIPALRSSKYWPGSGRR